MTLVVKKIDEKKLREFKAAAIKRGLKLYEAIDEAISLWLLFNEKILAEDEELNHLAYEREARKPEEKYKGWYAVFFEGKLQALCKTLEEVREVLSKTKPKHAVVAHIGHDKPEVLEWWGGSIEQLSA